MFKRSKKVYLELTNTEMRMLLKSLMDWRNKLIAVGRHTDPIDEMLEKLMTC